MGYPITPPRQWRQGSHCYYLVLNYVGLGPVVCGPPTRGCVHPRSHYPVGRLNTLHGSHTTDWSVRSMVMNTPSIICTLYHRIPYCTRNTTCTPCTRNTRTMIYAHTSDPTTAVDTDISSSTAMNRAASASPGTTSSSNAHGAGTATQAGSVDAPRRTGRIESKKLQTWHGS